MSRGRAGLKPGKRTTTAKYGTFVIVPPLFTALRGRERGRILTDFVDCNGKLEDFSMACCAGECVCVYAEKHSDVTHSLETCF